MTSQTAITLYGNVGGDPEKPPIQTSIYGKPSQTAKLGAVPWTGRHVRSPPFAVKALSGMLVVLA